MESLITEEKYKYKNFISVDNDHIINTYLLCNTAWIEIININFDNYKTFALLIKKIMEYFISNEIYYVCQNICENDTEYFTNSEIIKQENKIIAKTPIEYFIEDIINALGIKII